MKKSLFSVFFLLVLCISANNALAGTISDMLMQQHLEATRSELEAARSEEAAQLKLFKTILTKGEILHTSASSDGSAHYFTVVYKGKIYTCRTIFQNLNCWAIGTKS